MFPETLCARCVFVVAFGSRVLIGMADIVGMYPLRILPEG